MNPLTWLLDLIYPPKCVVCHKLLESSRAPVCPHCMDNLPEHDGAGPACALCRPLRRDVLL